MTEISGVSDAIPEKATMIRSSTIARTVAVVWIVSLLTLFVGFSGSELFDNISTGTGILAGIGMLALVWILNGPSSEKQQTIKLAVGLAGVVVYIASSVLVLVGFRGFIELAPWVMGGLGIYGVWMILAGDISRENASALLRGLRIAVGVGFLLLFISVLAIGTMDPTSMAASEADPVMLFAQTVGGGFAYFGFPLWLFLLARRLR